MSQYLNGAALLPKQAGKIYLKIKKMKKEKKRFILQKWFYTSYILVWHLSIKPDELYPQF